MKFIPHPFNTDLLSKQHRRGPELAAVGHKGAYNINSILKVLHYR